MSWSHARSYTFRLERRQLPSCLRRGVACMSVRLGANEPKNLRLYAAKNAALQAGMPGLRSETCQLCVAHAC